MHKFTLEKLRPAVDVVRQVGAVPGFCESSQIWGFLFLRTFDFSLFCCYCCFVLFSSRLAGNKILLAWVSVMILATLTQSNSVKEAHWQAQSLLVSEHAFVSNVSQ